MDYGLVCLGEAPNGTSPVGVAAHDDHRGLSSKHWAMGGEEFPSPQQEHSVAGAHHRRRKGSGRGTSRGPWLGGSVSTGTGTCFQDFRQFAASNRFGARFGHGASCH